MSSAIMKLLSILMAFSLASAIQNGGYTPPAFYTTTYGPYGLSFSEGNGFKKSDSYFKREGAAAGADLQQDQARASETNVVASGYDYFLRFVCL